MMYLKTTCAVALLSLPLVVSAQNNVDVLKNPTVIKIFDIIINPIVQLLFAGAVFYFMYGIFTYIRKADDTGERVAGANHILWSTVGMFIMFSVWGIIALIKNTLGV